MRVTEPNRNSALLWFPKIEAAGLPVPRTIFVPYSHRDCLSIFDGERSVEFDRLVIAVGEACEQIRGPLTGRLARTTRGHAPGAERVTGPQGDGRSSGAGLRWRGMVCRFLSG